MAGQVKTVGVVGVGTMGAGIAEVLSRTGLDVVAVEVDADVATTMAGLWKAVGSERSDHAR